MSERPRRAGRRFLRSSGGKRPPDGCRSAGNGTRSPHRRNDPSSARSAGRSARSRATCTARCGPHAVLRRSAGCISRSFRCPSPRAATRRPFRRTARRSARNNVAAPGSVRAGGTGPRRLPCRRPPDGRTGAGTYPSKPSVRPEKPSANDAARISGRRNRAGRSAPDTRSSPGTAPGPSTANREQHANPPRCGPTDATRRKSPAEASSSRRPPPEPRVLRT